MSSTDARKTKRQFLITWSALNFVGLMLGTFLVYLIAASLEYSPKFSAWRTFSVWLPLGVSVGLFQWVKLKQFRINFMVWVILTAVGFSILFTLYGWVLNFDAFGYRGYNIPDWVISWGLGLAVLAGGAFIGGLQSIIVAKHFSGVGSWILSYTFGSLLAFVMGFLAFTFKAIFLKTLYFFGLYDLAFGPAKYFLLYTFLVLVTAVYISLQTGKVLTKQLSLSANPSTG